MKKIYILLSLLLTMNVVGNSQITATTYPFTTSSGAVLEDLSVGSTQMVGAFVDDAPSSVSDIGFDFWFAGTRYAQFSANANGLVRLGTTVVGSTFTNDIATATNVPQIAPYWDDLYTGSNGQVRYKVVGTAPNRKLVVEWQNMQIPRLATNTPGAGNFQLWLYESTGVVEFVYGSGMVLNTANSGASIGIGTSATVYASATLNATSTSSTCAYGTANNLNTIAITAGTKFSFTPLIPADPSGFSITAITQSGMTLNWTDNATNEIGYAVYRSIDGGVNYSFVTQAAANAVSSVQTGLAPGTTYFWKVFAVTEGALSANAVSGNAATLPVGAIISTASGGLWSSPATWVGGVVPAAGDNVTIADGATVTIDVTTAACNNITVGQGVSGVLDFIATPASTLTINDNLTIAANGNFNAGTGSLTTHTLNIGGAPATLSAGSLVNNGIFDMNTTAGVTTTFFGSLDGSISGSGSITDLYAITVNKGSTQTGATLDITIPITMSVVSSSTNRLVITAGTFKISSATVITPIGGSQTVCAINGRLWLNNAGAIYNSGAAGSPTVTGELRIDNGTFNYGTGNNTMVFTAGSGTLRMSGGTINMLGAVSFASNGNTRLIMSGGAINVDPQVGAVFLAAGTPVFTIGGFANVNWTGGTITIVDPHNAVGGTAWSSAAGGVKNISGTATLNIGDGISTSPSTAGNTSGFGLVSGVALQNVVINNRTDITTTRMARLTGTTVVQGTVTILPNSYLFLGTAAVGNQLTLSGPTASLINTGTLAGCEPAGTQSIGTLYSQASTGAQTVLGNGNFVNMATLSIDNLGSSLTLLNTSTYKTRRVNLFDGSLTPGVNFIVGNQSATANEHPIIQYGSGNTALPAGTFTTFPTLDETEGQRALFYSISSDTYVMGFNNEIPTGAQTLTQLLTNNANGLTIPSDRTITLGGIQPGTLTMVLGNITMAGGGTLTLGNSVAAPGTLTYTAGTIVGKFKRWLSATVGNRDFPVGIAAFKRNASINFTGAPTSGGSLTAEWVSSPGGASGLPLVEGAINVTKTANEGYWTVTSGDGLGGGIYTGTFTATGISGISDVTQLVLVKRTNSVSPWTLDGIHVTGSGTPAAPVLSRSGMSGFSDFGIGSSDINVLPTGLLTFSGQKEGTVNKLRWTTSNEQNNTGFDVQRSLNGLVYTSIGFVNTQAVGGNSSDALNYSFVDNNPIGDKQYYRLRQVDIDNHSRLSNIVLIKGNKPVTLAIGGLFPNPATSLVNVIIDAPLKDKVTLVIMDVSGKSVIQQAVNVEIGSNTVPVDISRLTNGTYLVKLVCSTNCEAAVSKFVKQ